MQLRSMSVVDPRSNNSCYDRLPPINKGSGHSTSFGGRWNLQAYGGRATADHYMKGKQLTFTPVIDQLKSPVLVP